MPSPRTIQNHKQVREAGFTDRQTVTGMGGSPRHRFCLQGRCLPLMECWETLAVLTTKTQSFNYTHYLANSKDNSVHLNEG